MKGIVFVAVALVIVVPLVIAIIIQQRRQAEARTEAIKSMAARLRAEFRPDGSPELALGLAALPLCTRGSRRQFGNLLQNFSDNPGLAIFDYEYYQSSGQSGHYVRQTVACFTLDRQPVPEFTLHPESIVDKIAVKFGGQDINFDQYPVFSAKYRLRSPREAEIRRAFTPAVINWLEQEPSCLLECTGQRIIWYQGGKLIAPDQLEQFVHDARQFFNHVIPR